RVSHSDIADALRPELLPNIGGGQLGNCRCVRGIPSARHTTGARRVQRRRTRNAREDRSDHHSGGAGSALRVRRRANRRGPVLIPLVAATVLSVGLAMPRHALADIASDHPAAILVFPKLLVDTSSGLDTIIRISNVSDSPINVYCFYVDATPKCSL